MPSLPSDDRTAAVKVKVLQNGITARNVIGVLTREGEFTINLLNYTKKSCWWRMRSSTPILMHARAICWLSCTRVHLFKVTNQLRSTV